MRRLETVNQIPPDLCSFLALYVEWLLTDGYPNDAFTFYLNDSVDCTVKIELQSATRRRSPSYLATLTLTRGKTQFKDAFRTDADDVNGNQHLRDRIARLCYFLCRSFGIRETSTMGLFRAYPPEGARKKDPIPYLARQRLLPSAKEKIGFHGNDADRVHPTIFTSNMLMQHVAFAKYYSGLSGPWGDFERMSLKNTPLILKNKRAVQQRLRAISTSFRSRIHCPPHNICQSFPNVMRGVLRFLPGVKDSPPSKDVTHLLWDLYCRQYGSSVTGKSLSDFWERVLRHPRISNLFPQKNLTPTSWTETNETLRRMTLWLSSSWSDSVSKRR